MFDPFTREVQLQTLAVEQLDAIVGMLSDSRGRKCLPDNFLDWIADTATPYVEKSVSRACKSPRWNSSFDFNDPSPAMGVWVGHWLKQLVSAEFPELVPSMIVVTQNLIRPKATRVGAKRPIDTMTGFASRRQKNARASSISF